MNEWLRVTLFLPPQSSTVASSIDHLHYFVILTTFAGAAGVGLVAIYFTIRYRRRGPTAPREQPVTTPLWAEGLIVSAVFGLFFLWWVIGYVQYLRLRVPPENTYDVYVNAKQWMWKFAYAEGHQTIAQLYVPARRPVKLIMTSRDVIHSFYVPDFRVKQDVIPGRYTTLWFTVKEPGTHLIECAEYCGASHSMMRAQVIALDDADFAKWLASAPANEETPAPPREEPAQVGSLGPSTAMSLERLGEQVAAQEGCLRCHTLDGTPHIGPTWAGLYRAEVPLQGGGRAIADEIYLTESMMDPLVRIHAGYAPVMPSYLGRLRPGETAAIVALIKSLRDVARVDPLKPVAAPSKESRAREAGAMGPQALQPPESELQPAPVGIGAPPPSQQGLPPPGAQRTPPMQGSTRVGPSGPEKSP